MNAGILFYLARRTSQCQKRLSRYAGYFDLSVSSVKICPKSDELRASMSRLIAALPVVFLVSEAQERRPSAACALFEILHIPTDSNGEPKGVLRLEGTEKTGYLIESLNQAIVVLPDQPEELLQMLPAACARLNTKFSLNGAVPEEPELDYREIVDKSLGQNQPIVG